MKTTSYLIIWLTLFLVLILTILLGLLLLLLSDFYSLPLNRRRQLTPPTTTVADITTTTTTGNNSSTHSPSPLNTHALTDDPLNDIEKQLLHSPENQEKRQLQSPENQESGGLSMVYISNPIYGDGNGTPFETPDSSPSRLGTEDSSGDDEGDDITPELTPMKKLPVVACSVCLKDVRLMGMSESDVNSNNGVSSSCSLTPCTSSPSL
ncbi:hypothetical protein QVD17_26440 [Tagetes erecta]|uniref:Uncharacterized protein n=1 Tax=Tagetes erecta TaxID=13708 RepID=A0AAD8K7F3_TARER|nr:hypothetical protein QVD17_26440 [Tagetes erecta]